MTSPLPPLTALRAFEATVRLGSASAAAAELHVTHGAVSRQLQALEQAAGVALLERAGRGLAPTPAGRQLQQTAQAAFDQLRAGWAAIQPRPTDGPLVLGCPGSVLARWMIPRLEILKRDLPGLTLHLAAVEAELHPALPGLDAVLLLGQAPWPRGWQVRELAPERVGVVVAPSHPAAHRLRNVPPSALLKETLLHTRSRPQAWPAWAQSHGLDPALLQLGTGFEHLYYLLEAAVAGLGPAVAPEPLVAEDLAAGRLVAPWGFAATGGFWVLARSDGPSDPRVEALADWATAQLR